MIVSTLNEFNIISLRTRLQRSIDFEIPKEESLQYDLIQKGIAVFLFPYSSLKTLSNVLKTA